MASYIAPSRRGACTGCGKAIQLTRTSAPEPYCRDCRRKGKAPSRSRHGTDRRYASGCRCAVCRGAKNRRMREYRARRADRGEPVGATRSRSRRTCSQCGQEFLARGDSRARYCSPKCVGRSQQTPTGRGGARRRRRTVLRRRARDKINAAALGTTGGGRVWVQGACLVCGEQFLSPGLGSRYCSRECRATARSSRNWISFEDRRAIYVRDDWHCQICGEEASRRYSADDPWSPTLDHIVPRSAGGSDDPSNLRLSHLWCNSVRGDLSHYTDEDLREAA